MIGQTYSIYCNFQFVNLLWSKGHIHSVCFSLIGRSIHFKKRFAVEEGRGRAHARLIRLLLSMGGCHLSGWDQVSKPHVWEDLMHRGVVFVFAFVFAFWIISSEAPHVVHRCLCFPLTYRDICCSKQPCLLVEVCSALANMHTLCVLHVFPQTAELVQISAQLFHCVCVPCGSNAIAKWT